MSSRRIEATAEKVPTEQVGTKRQRPAKAGGGLAAASRATAAGSADSRDKKPSVKHVPASRAAGDGYESSGTESDDIDEDEIDLARPHAEGESEDDSGSSSDGSDDDDQINVEFEFFDPREPDFKSVRRLLEHYLPGEETTFDVSAMADAIVAQEMLGTMIKVEGDPDVYAFATVLPMSKYRVSVRLRSSSKAFSPAQRPCLTRSKPVSHTCLSILSFLPTACFLHRRRRRG